jgi:hypothetical protein
LPNGCRMIKILKAPLQLEPFLIEFKDLFTKPSYRSFQDLCGALSICDNKELKRRSRPVGAFPSDQSLMRLAGCIMINEEWVTGKKYLTMDVE